MYLFSGRSDVVFNIINNSINLNKFYFIENGQITLPLSYKE